MNGERTIADSELILTKDGRIYHLGIPPGFLSDKIITVGDPSRAEWVASYFDKIEARQQNREFVCITGVFEGSRLSIVSTGIGTDNIDIVFNEVDALFNFDFSNRSLKRSLHQLQFFRLGTSGAVSSNAGIGDIVISEEAIGFDALSHFYGLKDEFRSEFSTVPYYKITADEDLLDSFEFFPRVRTVTMPGFYGPQNRFLRLQNNLKFDFWEMVESLAVDNLEMESSGIYLLSHLMGHKAISINALLAHRKHGTFHPNPKEVVQEMIEKSLPVIAAI